MKIENSRKLFGFQYAQTLVISNGDRSKNIFIELHDQTD